MLVNLAAVFDSADRSAGDVGAVRDRSLRVAAIATIEDHQRGLEVVVRREIALGTDVEAERWPAGLLAEGLRGGHILAGVFALDVRFELGERRSHREECPRIGIALVGIKVEAHVEDMERRAVLVDDALDSGGEVPHRSRESRDLRDDHPIDLAGFEVGHEVGVSAPIRVRARSLVGVHFDSGGGDAEPISRIVVGELALAIEALVLGRHPNVECDGFLGVSGGGILVIVASAPIDLMNQWHATLTNAFGGQLLEGIGVLGGGSHEVTAITVTTYDSAYRYINEYGDRFGLLIADEEHHLPAPTYHQIPEMSIAPYRLGLTATYERADGKHELLDDLLGPVVYEEDVDALAGEYLSEYETIHMQVELTDEERSQYDEEYGIYREYVDTHAFDLWKEEGYAEFLKRTSYDPEGRRALIAKQRAERIARTAAKKLDTLDTLLKRHHDDRTIIFTANNEFAYEISQEFIIPCITHQTETEERTEILDRFRTGEYSMLATSQVLDEGIDVPAANVGIILSGSASKRQYAQRLGRILRPTDDRQPARLYEIIAANTVENYVSERRREGVGVAR